MNSNEGEDAIFSAALFAGSAGLIAFVALLLLSEMTFIPAAFIGILIAVIVFLIIFFAFSGSRRGVGTSAAHSSANSPASAENKAEKSDTDTLSSGASNGAGANDLATESALDSASGKFESGAPEHDASSAETEVPAREKTLPSGSTASASATPDATKTEINNSLDEISPASSATSDGASATQNRSTMTTDGIDAGGDSGSPETNEVGSSRVQSESSGTSEIGEDYDKDGIFEGTNEGSKPEMLTEARAGGADNLKEIKGVGPKMEQLLNSLGVYHFDQVSQWTADEVAWVDANLKGFKGRVSRDNWVDQAKILAAGGETEFSKRVDKGQVY